jgi:hypothetical protein
MKIIHNLFLCAVHAEAVSRYGNESVRVKKQKFPNGKNGYTFKFNVSFWEKKLGTQKKSA